MAAAAAPALVLGPPGWIVFAAAVAATAATAVILAQTSSRSESRSEPKARDIIVEDCAPPRRWRVRVHAQGTHVGGTSGSTVGAPPLNQPSPILVAQGVALADATFALLTARVQKNLQAAYEKCTQFIRVRPPHGFLGQKSFYGLSRDNNRFDVDSFGPSPNFIA
jgi:hypothetical protein